MEKLAAPRIGPVLTLIALTGAATAQGFDDRWVEFALGASALGRPPAAI